MRDDWCPEPNVASKSDGRTTRSRLEESVNEGRDGSRPVGISSRENKMKHYASNCAHIKLSVAKPQSRHYQFHGAAGVV